MSSPFVRRKTVALLATAGLCLSGLTLTGAYGAGAAQTGIPGTALAGTGDLKITDTGIEPFTEAVTGLADLDARSTLKPSAAQTAAVPAGTTVRWNRYGTPSSLSKVSGYLSGSRSGSAEDAARAYLRANRAVFGLSAAQVDDLQVLMDSKLTDSTAHVVRFQQEYGDLAAALDGMVTVGVAPGNRITYVASSLSRETTAPGAATLSATQAWTKAATELKDSGVALSIGDLGLPQLDKESDWTVFTVTGLEQLQRARLRALALPGAGVRPVFEVNVVDAADGKAVAYTAFVDAISGETLVRHNLVDNLSTMPKMTNTTMPFTGTFTATECGTSDHQVDAATRTVAAAATAANPVNDIVVNLKFEGKLIGTSDTATSPELATANLPAGHNGGTVTVEVCAFDDPTAPPLPPNDYAGTFIASEQEAPGGTGAVPYSPKWKYFPANPKNEFGPGTIDDREVHCFFPGEGCDEVLNNLAARSPWDQNQRSNLPTFTTMGNAANTAEAWLNPLAPGGAMQRPISTDRFYGDDEKPLQDFTDAWNNSKCSPEAFLPTNNNNDVQAAVTNLFSGHNRVHDFSYFLGFTERNSNMQDINFGLTDPSRENDPEIGNVQAGALSGGQPSYLGRDNANQITLQDGIPGITNQYLFQPIAGSFYAPCTDGDLDASIYGHEYTHAITNRMVAGPDGSLSGFQAGSMGESWGDLVGLEYLFSNDYDIDAASPWVVGPYATGNRKLGIRNYALDKNPLQYGDIGYDVTGPEVHADGEVWSAVMFDVRRELVKKWNAKFPESNKTLQRRCATGGTTQEPPSTPLRATQCPGNRRYIQLMFDSYLLQESATSMIDARDAFLAADKMRFDGANQAAIWQGFASDGMGSNARTKDTEDDQPTPGYKSPVGPEGTFSLSARGTKGTKSAPISGKLYIGDYEARATPIADTDPKTALPSKVRMVPGTYDFVFQADGYGLMRFGNTVKAGETRAREVHPSFNSASINNGASVDGASAGRNASKLLDDTESTNWAGVNPTDVSVDTPTAHPFVNVDLAGGTQLIRSVKVSAMLRPANPDQDEDTNQPDDESGSRFTALRQFAIEVCTERGSTNCSSTAPSGNGTAYKRIYTSPANAFDGIKPRPLAPTLLFKTFDVPNTSATHVRLVALENQCTGQAQFAGEQDNDPLNDTDCKAASDRDDSVRAAELEVFSYDTTTRPPGDPLVAMVGSGDALASVGDKVNYTFTYRNLGPKTSSDAKIVIGKLPKGLSFVKGTGKVNWDRKTRKVLWRLGNVRVNKLGKVVLTAKVNNRARAVDALVTTAQFSGKMTYSPPAAAVTVVTPKLG